MAKRHGKKYQEALKKVEEAISQNGDAGLEPKKAVEVARDTSTAKFDATVEAHIRLGIDVRHADQQLRSAVTLPRGTGKHVRVAVFAAGEKEREAKDAGADIVGGDDLVKRVSEGFTDFHGKVDDINPERGKLKVLVNMFGRETPVELDLLQVEKVH